MLDLFGPIFDPIGYRLDLNTYYDKEDIPVRSFVLVIMAAAACCSFDGCVTGALPAPSAFPADGGFWRRRLPIAGLSVWQQPKFLLIFCCRSSWGSSIEEHVPLFLWLFFASIFSLSVEYTSKNHVCISARRKRCDDPTRRRDLKPIHELGLLWAFLVVQLAAAADNPVSVCLCFRFYCYGSLPPPPPPPLRDAAAAACFCHPLLTRLLA